MTPPDDLIRDSLRDLIPDYQGPADPFTRVGVTIVRRRRSRRRALVVGAMAAVVLVSVGVPTLLRLGAPAVVAPGGSGPGGTPQAQVPLPAAPVVASGTVGGRSWSVRGGPLSADARRCLRAEDAVFASAALCFDDWSPGQPASWAAVQAVHEGLPVSAYFGVAPALTARLVFKLSNGQEVAVSTRPGPTNDPQVSYFALVTDQPGLTVRSAVPYAADGELQGAPLFAPGVRPCTPGAGDNC